MSQFPRRVLTDTDVAWDLHANGAARSTFTRHGTVVDLVPGSLLVGPRVATILALRARWEIASSFIR